MILDFYGLREQPFGVTPDPAYLYASRTHCAALDSLSDAILSDRGFLALIADPGMGKTTLLHQVLDSVGATARAVFLFQTQCDSREFFQYLMSELGVDFTGMGLVAMHNKLNEILFNEMLAGRRFVLIVDEAQNLDDNVLETIRMLSNFETTHAKLMQIILAGQPQLGEKLQQKHLAQLLQRLTVVQYLEPFTPEETAGYIHHRLKVAGYQGLPLFDSSALALIAEESRGIPRDINKICFRALLEGYAADARLIGSDLVEKAIRRHKLQAPPRPQPASSSAPALIPVPPPPQAALQPAPQPKAVAAAAGAGAVAGANLTYPATKNSRWNPWKLRTISSVVLLLFGSLLLPHDAIPRVAKTLQQKLTATRDLVQRQAAELARSSPVPRVSPGAGSSLISNAGFASLPNVTSVEAFTTASDAQVVVNVDTAVQYDSARLDSPDRVYFDLRGARLAPSVDAKISPAQPGLLQAVRVAQNADGGVRLVLDAGGPTDFSAKLLPDPYRLVIDVRAKTSPAGDAPQESLARELGLKVNRIAIDPGHGGYDTGTIGPHGLMEKDLCLDVAMRLGQLLKENLPGAEIIYTRTDDRHVSLEERTAIANDAGADLFISVHANSSRIRDIRGAETFYFSLADSREARDLASRENALSESSLHELPDLLRKITRNEKVAESRQLAADIQQSLSAQLQAVSRQETNRGVKHAPFLVLTGANMPAVLSEISFVSNAADESLLLESAQRQRIAEALFRGVSSYLNRLSATPAPNLAPQRQGTAQAVTKTSAKNTGL